MYPLSFTMIAQSLLDNLIAHTTSLQLEHQRRNIILLSFPLTLSVLPIDQPTLVP